MKCLAASNNWSYHQVQLQAYITRYSYLNTPGAHSLHTRCILIDSINIRDVLINSNNFLSWISCVRQNSFIYAFAKFIHITIPSAYTRLQIVNTLPLPHFYDWCFKTIECNISHSTDMLSESLTMPLTHTMAAEILLHTKVGHTLIKPALYHSCQCSDIISILLSI